MAHKLSADTSLRLLEASCLSFCSACSVKGGKLGRGCPLFARKFPADTAQKVLEASFNMLIVENKVAPQGHLVSDAKTPGFDKQCRALAQAAASKKARKQLYV